MDARTCRDRRRTDSHFRGEARSEPGRTASRRTASPGRRAESDADREDQRGNRLSVALADSGIIKPKHPTFRRFGRQFQVCVSSRQREKKRLRTIGRFQGVASVVTSCALCALCANRHVAGYACSSKVSRRCDACKVSEKKQARFVFTTIPRGARIEMGLRTQRATPVGVSTSAQRHGPIPQRFPHTGHPHTRFSAHLHTPPHTTSPRQRMLSSAAGDRSHRNTGFRRDP